MEVSSGLKPMGLREQLLEMMGRRTILWENPSQSKHQGARQTGELFWAGSRRQEACERVFNPPGKMSDTLQQASVQVIESTQCNAEDAYQGEVTEKMLCAGILEGGVDTCQVGPPRIRRECYG
ncbi:hypothetical protein MC885_003799 [Smutsia gigantea]|nr:hypothetical protein MC885_003799 [Smutsia gigantea]